MDIFDQINRETNQLQRHFNTVQDRDQWWQPISGLSLYDLPANQDAYRSFAYACIHKGAINFAKGHPSVYREQFKKRVEIETHTFLKLTKRLNIYGQSYKDLLYWLYTQMKMYGFQIWRMPTLSLPIGGEWLMDIVPVSSKYVTPVFNSQNTLIDYYEYTHGNSSEKLYPKDIVIFKYPNLDNPLLWTAPVSKFNFTLDIDYLQGKQNKSLLLNNARIPGVLQIPGKVGEEFKKSKQQQWEQEQASPENAGKIAMLGDGMKYIPNQFSPMEMDNRQSRLAIRDEICTILEIDKTIMGITEDVNLANSKSALENFTYNTLIPFSDTFFEPQITAFGKRLYGERFIFDNEYVFETNRELQLKTIKTYTESGKWTDNEIRDLDGYESVIDERADSIYRQDFFTPIGETEKEKDEE